MATYSDLIKQNVAPYAAKKIGVYDSKGSRVGEISLGDFKPDYGERLYRFGILSDVHNQQDQTAESTQDLQHALDHLNNKESVSFTVICGDISQNGTASEFQIYQNNVNTKSPNTPVYATTGNHDCGQGTSGLSLSAWKQYTGNHDRCFEITQGTDHFLFFGMNKWSLGNSGTPYVTTDIDWLESKLQKYQNDRCFIITHLFFPSRAGNLNSIYPNGNWLGGSQLNRIQGLCDTYKNTYWFSGHSHWKWYLQKYQSRANVYRNNCGWCVHIPSCAIPIDSDGTTRVEKPLESEGAIVDVYTDYIDIRGINFKTDKYIPIAQYRLYTDINHDSGGGGSSGGSTSGIPAGYTTVTADNFTVRTDTGATSFPSAATTTSDGYISITFTAASQKFWVQTANMKSSTSKVEVYVEDVIYEPEPSAENKMGLGFYQNDGYYGIETGTVPYYNASENTAVQFNSSSSKYNGTYPVTIKMKNLALKCS